MKGIFVNLSTLPWCLFPLHRWISNISDLETVVIFTALNYISLYLVIYGCIALFQVQFRRRD